MKHHARVLPDGIQHHRIAELGRDLPDDGDGLGFELLQVNGQRPISYGCIHWDQCWRGSDSRRPVAMKWGLRITRLAVAERRAVEIHDFASGGAQHGVAGGRVPLHRGPVTRVEIGLTGGEEAELQR